MEAALRERKNVLLREVAQKAALLSANAEGNLAQARRLLRNVAIAREIGACLVPLRSFASFAQGDEVLSELESLQVATQDFQFHREKLSVKGIYVSNFKPLIKELSTMGCVPDLESLKKEEDYSTYAAFNWQTRMHLTQRESAALAGFLSGEDGTRVSLLYRASRDGFTGEAFHARCDNKGPTLLLIRAKESGNIFGAFCVASYESPADAGASVTLIDPTGTSFVFSLRNAAHQIAKFNLIDHNKAMVAQAKKGPMIGGKDINLGEDFGAPQANSCTPTAFGAGVAAGSAGGGRRNSQPGAASPGEQKQSPEVQYDSSLLGGSPTWSAAEIECFSVKPFGLLDLLHHSHILRMKDIPHLSRFCGTMKLVRKKASESQK
jgi:hypothetical protein